MRLASKAQCPECGRVFDLTEEDDAQEWYYGHDCQVVDPDLPLDRPPRMYRSNNGGWRCLDCGLLVILFDDDEHYCEATGTSSELHQEEI